MEITLNCFRFGKRWRAWFELRLQVGGFVLRTHGVSIYVDILYTIFWFLLRLNDLRGAGRSRLLGHSLFTCPLFVIPLICRHLRGSTGQVGGVRFSGFENAAISGLVKNVSYWYYGFEGKSAFHGVRPKVNVQSAWHRFSTLTKKALKSGLKTGSIGHLKRT